MTSSLAGLAQVQQNAIAQGAGYIGDLVSYDVERIEIPRAKLREIFESFGYGSHVVDEMDARTALSRAAGRPVPGNIVIERFARPNKDTAHAVGIYLKTPREGEAGDRIDCGARVRIENKVTVALPPEGASADPACLEIAQRISTDANKLILHAETTDVTAAVISVLTGPLQGIAMRRRGGFYFVRPQFSGIWQQIAAALTPYGFTGLSCPLAGDQRSVTMAKHHAKASLEGDLADLRAELEKVNEKTRDSTITKRLKDVEDICAKAELYKDLLGDWIAELDTKAAALRKGFKERLVEDDVFSPIE